VFIATLAGSFAVKAGSSLAEEDTAASFLRLLGVPVPETRMIHQGHPEHRAIVKAVQKVAVQYALRGDYAPRVEDQKLTRFNGPLLLMQCVSSAQTLAQIDRETANACFEIGAASSGSDAERAVAEYRLESIGRCWVGDLLLRFRDRFCSRGNLQDYDTVGSLQILATLYLRCCLCCSSATPAFSTTSPGDVAAQVPKKRVSGDDGYSK
jgi:hypothetical protein